MVEDAVNGKAVHGTGGVNYLPHMFVFLVCIRASAAVSLAQGHNATDLCLGTEAFAVQGRSAAIVDEDDRFKENIEQAHLRVRGQGPKGFIGSQRADSGD
jgi:hypothetical protein